MIKIFYLRSSNNAQETLHRGAITREPMRHSRDYQYSITQEPSRENQVTIYFFLNLYNIDLNFFLDDASFFSSNVLLEHIPNKKQKSGETFTLFEKYSCL